MVELASLRSMFWLLSVTAGLLLAALAVAWWLHLRARRAAERRSAAMRLVESLKAYAAWVECQRAEPMVGRESESPLPEPLERAVRLKDLWFPQLGPAMLRLLQTHAAMMETLWQHHLLRISHGASQSAVYADPHYQDLRDRQDAAVDQVIAECRRLVGEGAPQWHRTRSDFTFTSGLSLPSHPGSR